MNTENNQQEENVKYLTQGEVMWLSTQRGLVGFTTVGIATFGLSYYLHHNNPFYKNKFAISAKVGLPLMASLFVGSVLFELTMFDAHINPENWQHGEHKKPIVKHHKSVPIHHWILNRVHDKPFYFAALMGLPVGGNILYSRMKEPHLSISQALLQTRVMAQLSILGIVLTTMGIKTYIDRHGKFPEGDE